MNLDVLKNGLQKLKSKGEQNGASIVFISTIVICVHTLYSFIRCLTTGETFVSYGVIVALAMLLYAIGRRMYDVQHLRNFEMIYDAKNSIAEVKSIEGAKLDEISKDISSIGNIFYYKNTISTTGGFLEHSKNGEDGKPLGTKMVAISIAMSVVLAIVVLAVHGFNGGADTVIATLAAMFAAVMPSMFELVGAFVFARNAEDARSQGSVVSGIACAEKHSEIENVLADDRELFRKGTVVVKAMNILDKSQIYTIVPAVASVFVEIDSPARFAFMGIINNNTKLLMEVESFERVGESGLIAKIEGREFLLGSRAFMVEKGVIAADDTKKYFKQGKARFNMYVAVDGKLGGVFSIAYLLDKAVGSALLEMDDDGVKTVVTTLDPNLNEDCLRRLFLVSEDALLMMEPTDVASFKELIRKNDKIGRSGLYITKKSILSFATLIRCVKAITYAVERNHSIMRIMMIAAPIVLAMIALVASMANISPFVIVILQIVCNIPLWISSLLSR